MGTGQQLSMDLARVAALTSIILLHSTRAPSMVAINQDYVYQWWTWNIFSSLAWIGVPLFIMVTGALLLRPERADEPLGTFFRKRWKRIGLPFFFWGAIYVIYTVFVNHTPVNSDFALRLFATGPYFQFWYIYMLLGLYLATPVLRILIAHMTRKMFTYIMLVWLVGSFLEPFWILANGMNPTYVMNVSYLFVFSGYLGCFLFGAYLRDLKLRPILPFAMLAVGIVWSILGNYYVASTISQTYNYLIFGNLTGNVLLTATGIFLILTKIRYTNPLFSLISQNTLPIYLGHVMILESFQRGYFGFVISSSTITLALEIPVMVAATLLVTTLIVVPLKKIPGLGKLVG